MDARGFGSDRRSQYREVRWQPLDFIVAGGGLVVLAAALVFIR
jgi:energy-coupling factor transporter transmembrane protein EcfT